MTDPIQATNRTQRVCDAEDSDVRPFEAIEPPYWWRRARRYAVASRHLPDGTREITVLGRVRQGAVIDNARVFGAVDVGWRMTAGNDAGAGRGEHANALKGRVR